MSRFREQDPRKAAEAVFSSAKKSEPAKESTQAPIIPGAKEQVTLRLDKDVVEYFQSEGSGWQGRMNDALRRAAGL
jgi:uncharacterized protein (DUF4415 family)